MTCRTGRLDEINKRVLVTVYEDPFDGHPVSAGAALLPKLSARTAPERGATRLQREFDRFRRGEGNHAHFTGQVILRDNRKQTVLVEFHASGYHKPNVLRLL